MQSLLDISNSYATKQALTYNTVEAPLAATKYKSQITSSLYLYLFDTFSITAILCSDHYLAVQKVAAVESFYSYFQFFKPKYIKFDTPCFLFNLVRDPRNPTDDQYKYLGIMICSKNSDVDTRCKMYFIQILLF